MSSGIRKKNAKRTRDPALLGASTRGDDGKPAKWLALFIFLIAITIVPSYEAIYHRHVKSVDIGECPGTYLLCEGDVIRQKIVLDGGDRLKKLCVWLSVPTASANTGKLEISLAQDGKKANAIVDASRLVGSEYVPIHLPLRQFGDGELDLTLRVLDLAEGASVSVRWSGEAVYGLPGAVLNDGPCTGTLSMYYELRQIHDLEFCVSMALVLVIIAASAAASYVLVFTEETPRTGWAMIGIYAVLAMALLALRLPGSTWEGESKLEGATFFYDNVANMGIPEAFRQLEGGMYLSTLSNILMAIAVRVLHLRENVFIFVQSMGVLFWVMCLASFCSHYFKKYFTRAFRFVFPLLFATYGFVCSEYIGAAYFGTFFLIMLLIYDFEEINPAAYGLVLVVSSVICMSKMMFVVFAPLSVIYFLLFGKEMNGRKKICIGTIGVASLLEGALSLYLRNGVQSGSSLGTIQNVSIPVLIHKVVYYTVQTFGMQLRLGLSNSNQLLENLCMAALVIGILSFAFWQIAKKGKYAGEAKFIIAMFCLIVTQCVVILLTTPDWHADISWRQSVKKEGRYHFFNLFAAAGFIFCTLLWVAVQWIRPYYEKFQSILDAGGKRAMRALGAFFISVLVFFYINQYPGAKDFASSNPLRSTRADWRTYSSMLDSDAFCIRIEGEGWYYKKNAEVKSVSIARSNQVDLSGIPEASENVPIVIYAHKAAATNQALDRYYYMAIYGNDGNLISKVRQMNSDPERLYVAFNLGDGIPDIGRVEFSYEDGSRAFVDESIEIGYR